MQTECYLHCLHHIDRFRPAGGHRIHCSRLAMVNWSCSRNWLCRNRSHSYRRTDTVSGRGRCEGNRGRRRSKTTDGHPDDSPRSWRRSLKQSLKPPWMSLPKGGGRWFLRKGEEGNRQGLLHVHRVLWKNTITKNIMIEVGYLPKHQ